MLEHDRGAVILKAKSKILRLPSAVKHSSKSTYGYPYTNLFSMHTCIRKDLKTSKTQKF